MSASPATLLRSARVGSGAEPCDVVLAGGRVARIGERMDADDVDDVVDLAGRNLLPGLWDHHVHFDQWVLARKRLDLTSTTSAAEVVDLVAERLRDVPPEGGLPLVGVGFRDGLWPDSPHRELLDAVAPETAVVLLGGDLHCCWVNSAAARRYGQADHPSGLLREGEAEPVMHAVRELPAGVLDVWVAEAARAAAACGVVGIVELEAPWQLDTWVHRVGQGTRSLRVSCGVWPPLLEDAIARGLRTGDVIAGSDGLISMGPLKVITDGSLNTRTAYCHDPYPGLEGTEHAHGMLRVPPAELESLMRRAWSHGIHPAIHAIGDHANTLVLDAFAAVAARGSVEHAQLLRRDDIARFADLGVVASVQPEHALDDRDVADRYWAGRTDRAFALRDLLAAGTTLALGSDAPVAPLDPWITIAAAVHRTRDDRPRWHPDQEIPLEVALASSSRGRAAVAVGDAADLVVVERDPYTAPPSQLRTMHVAGTLLGGRWTWRSGI
jgi:hypothetical protein